MQKTESKMLRLVNSVKDVQLLMTPITATLLLLAMFAQFLVASRSNAHSEFCTPGKTMFIELKELQELTLVPTDDTVGSSDRIVCKWEITVEAKNDHSQLVLQMPHHNDASNMAKYLITRSTSEPENTTHVSVSAGSLHVVPLTRRISRFLVETSWDPKTQLSGPATLTISIPVPGFCSGDMLSFNGHCYAVTPVHSNVLLALSAYAKGFVQLANFINLSIDDFIANNFGRGAFPSKQPLDLSRPISIGLFYDPANGSFLYIFRGEAGCELRPIESPHELLVKAAVAGVCGSLMVDAQGNPVFVFGNCNTEQAALISFPENSSSYATSADKACSETLMRQVAELQDKYPSRNHQESKVQTTMKTDNLTTQKTRLTTGATPERKPEQDRAGRDIQEHPGLGAGLIIVIMLICVAIPVTVLWVGKTCRHTYATVPSHESSAYINL